MLQSIRFVSVFIVTPDGFEDAADLANAAGVVLAHLIIEDLLVLLLQLADLLIDSAGVFAHVVHFLAHAVVFLQIGMDFLGFTA